MASTATYLLKDDDELLAVKTVLQQALGLQDPATLPHVLALARCSQLTKARTMLQAS